MGDELAARECDETKEAVEDADGETLAEAVANKSDRDAAGELLALTVLMVLEESEIEPVLESAAVALDEPQPDNEADKVEEGDSEAACESVATVLGVAGKLSCGDLDESSDAVSDADEESLAERDASSPDGETAGEALVLAVLLALTAAEAVPLVQREAAPLAVPLAAGEKVAPAEALARAALALMAGEGEPDEGPLAAPEGLAERTEEGVAQEEAEIELTGLWL